jgi:hypothetical protein
MRMLLAATGVGLIIAASFPAVSSAQCVSRSKISGKWLSDDGGTYLVRRADNNVIWWMGQSGDDGRSWINVFRGVYDPKSNTFTGEWSDVHATNFTGPGNQGTLTLRLNGTLTAVNGFDKVSATGAPFGGKWWFFSLRRQLSRRAPALSRPGPMSV